MEAKICEYEFVISAIKTLHKPPYKGIHSVYSGFKQAFREYFGKDPVEATTKLAQEGKIVTRPVEGGGYNLPTRRRASWIKKCSQ